MDDLFWKKAARYRRIAAAVGDEEMKRKAQYPVRLGSATGDEKGVRDRLRKSLAAD